MKWKDRKNVYRIIITRGLYREERKRRKEQRKEGVWNERIERMCIEL